MFDIQESVLDVSMVKPEVAGTDVLIGKSKAVLMMSISIFLNQMFLRSQPITTQKHVTSKPLKDPSWK